MVRVLLLVVIVASGWLAHQAQRLADSARLQSKEQGRVFVPSGEAVRTASMGYHTMVADLFWIRAVLTFADIFDDDNRGEVIWLTAMLDSVATLDPSWRTVYYHGGGMLRICGALEESDALFLRGMEALPGEPYFPFAVAMNAYLYHQDLERAAHYLNLAAAVPGAPPWYRAAAAGFIEEGGQRQAAIHYLQEQLEVAGDPAIEEALHTKLNALMHDDLVERIAAKRAQLIESKGRDILSLDELSLPEDPLGGEWVLAPDGKIRSSIAEETIREKAQRQERAMLTTDFAVYSR